MENKAWYLKNLDIFSSLAEDRLAEIERIFEMKLFGKGHNVFNSQTDEHIYIVKTGKVELSTLNKDGSKYILDILKKGSIFGNLGIGNRAEIFVDAIDDSYVCYVEKNHFFKLISREPSVSEKLLAKMFDQTFKKENVKQKIDKMMLSLGYKDSESTKYITDKLTHEQIANMIGVSRQTITTLINELEREGRLSRVKKQFLYNREDLERII